MRTVGQPFRRMLRRRSRHERRGAAVVEMAVVAPLLLAVLFGIMEFGWAFMVHENLTDAARECARLASLQGTTDAEIIARFEDAMKPTGITITPGMIQIQHATVGNPIVTVSVSVPYSDVTITGLTSFLGITRQNLTSACSMRKEGAL